MNIQQIHYVLAVADNRHFERAAQQCFISQSTLSTMVSRLEEELGIQLFDRRKKPVDITPEGEVLIEQLRIINKELNQLTEITQEIKGEVKGNLTISVIPTIAPYLLPLFLQKFARKFPDLSIEVKEQTTAEIIRQLKGRELDIGIISIPVSEEDIVETHLYNEPFLFYNAAEVLNEKLKTEKLDVSNLCLLEEGHCMRTQVINLCDLHRMNLRSTLNFDYKAGSIDGLLRFVRANDASTLLPYLATTELTAAEKTKLSEFSDPVPYRSVGLAVHRHFVKKKILETLKEFILKEVNAVLPLLTERDEQLSPL